MANVAKTDHGSIVSRTANLLGGKATFKRVMVTTLDAHEVILSGFPGLALVHLSKNVGIIQRRESFEKALGLSFRTFQRRKKETIKKLSQEQSGRAWKFAEIFEKATEVFGSQAEAEQFLEVSGANSRARALPRGRNFDSRYG